MSKPTWVDQCHHEDGWFIGVVHDTKGDPHDVYVYPDKGYGLDLGVCIRWGNDDPDYYSPGELGDFIKRAPATSIPVYQAAAQAIIAYMANKAF